MHVMVLSRSKECPSAKGARVDWADGAAWAGLGCAWGWGVPSVLGAVGGITGLGAWPRGEVGGALGIRETLLEGDSAVESGRLGGSAGLLVVLRVVTQRCVSRPGYWKTCVFLVSLCVCLKDLARECLI